MDTNDDKKLALLLKEYDTLRSEVVERMKIAFSHIGYALTILGIALSLLPKDTNWSDAAKVGFVCTCIVIACLTGLSALNWSWVRRCACRLRNLEIYINRLVADGEPFLQWEQISEKISNGPLGFPSEYRENAIPSLTPPSDAPPRQATTATTPATPPGTGPNTELDASNG